MQRRTWLAFSVAARYGGRAPRVIITGAVLEERERVKENALCRRHLRKVVCVSCGFDILSKDYFSSVMQNSMIYLLCIDTGEMLAEFVKEYL